jgi:hypothetical protein
VHACPTAWPHRGRTWCTYPRGCRWCWYVVNQHVCVGGVRVGAWWWRKCCACCVCFCWVYLCCRLLLWQSLTGSMHCGRSFFVCVALHAPCTFSHRLPVTLALCLSSPPPSPPTVSSAVLHVQPRRQRRHCGQRPQQPGNTVLHPCWPHRLRRHGWPELGPVGHGRADATGAYRGDRAHTHLTHTVTHIHTLTHTHTHISHTHRHIHTHAHTQQTHLHTRTDTHLPPAACMLPSLPLAPRLYTLRRPFPRGMLPVCTSIPHTHAPQPDVP